MKKVLALLLAFSLTASTAFSYPDGGSGFKSKGAAKDVTVDTTRFTKNLSSTDKDVQHALETLDQLSGTSAGSPVSGCGNNQILRTDPSGNLSCDDNFNFIEATSRLKIGSSNTASNNGATAIGISNTASGAGGTAIGGSNLASGDESVAMGNGNQATFDGTFAVGNTTQATNTAAFSWGQNSIAAGVRSMAGGNTCNTGASAQGAVALGTASYASGADAFAMGDNNIRGADLLGLVASGDASMAFGYVSANNKTLTATGTAAIAIGQDVNATADNTFALGTGYTNSSASSFDVGFGQADFTVSSGAIGLNGNTTLADAKNIVVGSTTGTKIGTATSQKLAFYNSTPIVQPGATTDLGTVLSNLGIRASGTAYPITTSGAVNFTGGLTVATAGITVTDVDMALGTTTGTKFGTATNQKLAFYNSTPIVQPSGNIITALTNDGLIASPTIAASNISSGTLAVAQGGTNLGSYAVGDILYASGATTIAKLADVATGSILVAGGVTTAPAYSATPTITTSVTCPLLIGGTGATSTLTLQSTSASGTSGADILFKSGNNGGTEIARARWDGTFGLFGIGKTPTAFCDITGATPVSVSGTGTTATATFFVLGATGGSTTGSTGQNGGIGSLFSMTAGTGGSVPGSVSNPCIGGQGGAGTISSGAGGAVNGSGSTYTAGAGGTLNINSGAGGSSNTSSTTTTGGKGGTIAILAGNGGSSTSGGASTSTSGAGGDITMTAGNGAVASSSGGTNVFGAAGTITILAGSGGTSSTSAATVNGGAITITAGTGGSNNSSGTAGSGGNLTLAGGTAANSSSGTNGIGGSLIIEGGLGSNGAGGPITFKTAVTSSYVVCGTIDKNGRWAIGGTNTTPTGLIHLAAGSATASTAPLKFTSGPLLSSAEAGAMEFLTDAYYLTTTTGAIRRMIVAGNTGRSAGATAAVASVATYTLGAADASYEVSANVNVTTATAHNFTVTCAYTDEGNTARTLTFGFTQLTGSTFITAITNVTGTGPYESPVFHIRCKASTAITIATTGTFTTVTYNVEGVIKQIA